MAYDVRYTLAGQNHLGEDIEVELYQIADPVEIITPLPMSGPGYTVRQIWPQAAFVYTPFLPLEYTLYAQDAGQGILDEIEINGTLGHYVIIRRDVAGGGFVNEWYGVVVPGPTEQNDDALAADAEVQVIADCGLSQFKDILFLEDDNLTLPTGRMSFVEVLALIFRKLPFQLDFWTACGIRSDDVAASGDPLTLVEIDVANYRTEANEPVYCDQVLSDILRRFYLSVVQSQGQWHFYNPHIYEGEDATFTRYRYNSAGVLQATEAAWDPAVELTQDEINWARQAGSTRSTIRGLAAATVVTKYGGLPNLIKNGDFGSYQATRTRSGRGERPLLRGRGDTPYGRSGVTNSGDGAVGRNRAALGRYTPEAGIDGRLGHLDSWDPFGYTAPDIVRLDGQGIDGNTAIFLPAIPIELHGQEDDYFRSRAATKYLTNTDPVPAPFGFYSVVAGASNQLLFSGSAQAKLLAGRDDITTPFPFYVVIRIVEDGTGDLYYLGRDGAWTDRTADPNNLKTGMIPWVDRGLIPGGWFTENILSDAIPVTGKLHFIVFGAVDTKMIVSPEALQLDGVLISNFSLDLIIDGVQDSTAHVVTVYDVATNERATRNDMEVLIGDLPIIGDPAGITAGDTDATSLWSVDNEADAALNGKSLDEIVAQLIFTGQRQGVSTSPTLDLLGDTGFVFPHQCWQLPNGLRYRPRNMQWLGGTAEMKGSWHQVRKDGVAPGVGTVTEQAERRGLLTSDNSAAFLVQASDNVFNAFLQKAVTVTTEPLIIGTDYPDIDIEAPGGDAGEMLNAIGLVIINPNTARPFFLRLTDNVTASDTNMQVEDFNIPATDFTVTENIPPGAEVYVVQDKILSLLSQTVQAFLVMLQQGAVATLAEDITNEVRTAITVEAIPMPLRAGRNLVLIASVLDGGGDAVPTDAVPLNMAADAAVGALSLTIDEQRITGRTGDKILLSGVDIAAELLVRPWKILLMVEEIRQLGALASLASDHSGITTSLDVTTTTGALLDDTILEVVSPDGQVRFLVQVNDAAGVAKGATAITIDSFDFTTLMPTGSTVRPAVGWVSDQMHTSQASIVLNATSITHRVAEWNNQAIATMNADYSASTTTVDITGLTRNIKRYDNFLIFQQDIGGSSPGQVTRVIANADLVATGGSQTLTIVSQTVHAKIGDPMLSGTMSQMRQEKDGFRITAKIFGTDSWNGTVDEDTGIISAGGSTGWMLTDSGDADITGTLHFGGGLGGGGGEAGPGGIKLDAGEAGDPGFIQWRHATPDTAVMVGGVTIIADIVVALGWAGLSLTKPIQMGNSSGGTPPGVALYPHVHIGTDQQGVAHADTVLDLNSTDFALRMPRLDTTARDLLGGTAGLFIWNTTTTQFEGHDGSSWAAIGGGGTPGGSVSQIQFHDTGPIFGGAANLYWDKANDRLGIGHATPDSKLVVNFGSQRMFRVTEDWISHTDQTGGEIRLRDVGGAGAYEASVAIKGVRNASTGAGDMQFFVTTTAGVETYTKVMTLDSLGNLGIGIDEPDERLHVDGSAKIAGYVDIEERGSAPAAPDTGFTRLYSFTTQSGLYYQDDADVTHGVMVQTGTAPATDTLPVADGTSGIRWKVSGVSIISNQVRTTGGYLATSTGYFAIATGGAGTDETQYKAGKIVLEGEGDFFFLQQEKTGGGTATQIQSDPNGALSLGYDGTPFKIETALYGGVINGQLLIDGLGNTGLTGSINPTASTSVVGIGTLFNTELIIGDRILVNSETRTVVAIASNTALTVESAFTDTGTDFNPDKVPAGLAVLDGSDGLNFVVSSTGDLRTAGYIDLAEISAPGAPLANIGRLFCKAGSTDVFWHHGDGGGEVNLTDTGTGSPGGSDTHVQFNDGGAFGGESGLIWIKATNRLGIGISPAVPLHVSGNAQIDGNLHLMDDNYLQFGTDVDAFIRYDASNNRTVFRSDVDFRLVDDVGNICLQMDVSASNIELYKGNDRVALTTSLGLTLDDGNQLVLDGDGPNSAIVFGETQDLAMYWDDVSLVITNVPTSDPFGTNRLWSDGGTLKLT